MRTLLTIQISRLRVFLAVALTFGFATASWAGRFSGGTGRADCYSEFEVDNVATARSVKCMDNTACDADTTCGQCTIGVAPAPDRQSRWRASLSAFAERFGGRP